ncbi:MAG TPA: TonB-dependent receptor, partial [Gemmatimonadaceae bacterium]|nr:TonB-dependent receptor [Gemmatimonadaceae bacterium]
PSLRVNVPYLFTTSNEDIERIEILLGPAAALYGPNSANGVLHVITKSPFTSQGTTMTLDAGERGVVRVAARQAGVAGSSFGYKLTGEYMQGKDWRFVDPAEPATFPNTPNTPRPRVGQANRRDYDIERYGGEARVDWRFGENAEWINSYGLVHVGNSIELTGANGAAQIRDWTIQSVQSRLRAGRVFAQVFANLSDAGNADSTDLGGTYILRTGQPIVDNSRAIGSQLQHSIDIGRNTVVYGADYIFTNPRTGGTINGRNEEDDDVTEYGGYFQSTSKIASRLDLLLAARLDKHSELEGTFFSPRAAIVFMPAEEQSVRLTFNRAYSTPANFSFFLDLLQAGNISGLPFNVRAVGVPENGFNFRRDCAGGVGSLCMRSPFTPAGAGGPGAFVPANAAGYYPAALQVAVLGGLRNSLIAGGLSGATADTVIQRLGTFNAAASGVGTNLTYVTNGTTVSPSQVRDLPRLKASFTNVLELGYKGTVGQRLVLAADAWYQQRENFTTAAANFTPNALLNGPTLGAGLVGHLTPTIGAARAAAVGPVVANALARIPLGTVVPDSRVTTNGDIAFTYQTIEKTIDLHGADVAFDFLLTDALTMTGTYSWVSDVEFPEIESGQRPLTLNAPDHKGSLGIKWDAMQRAFTGELRARYQNTFPVNSAVFVTGVNLPAPGGGTYQYRQPPTSTFVDAQVTMRRTLGGSRGMLWSIGATNLLDRRVPVFAGVPDIGRLVMTRLQFTL